VGANSPGPSVATSAGPSVSSSILARNPPLYDPDRVQERLGRPERDLDGSGAGIDR
jgi:hypothetical protein